VLQSRQRSWSVHVGRDADLSPPFCIGCTCCLGLDSELNGVAAQQKMCRQTIAGSQKEDELGYLDRIAGLIAPVRFQRVGERAHVLTGRKPLTAFRNDAAFPPQSVERTLAGRLAYDPPRRRRTNRGAYFLLIDSDILTAS
jgi:hypothetical protein